MIIIIKLTKQFNLRYNSNSIVWHKWWIENIDLYLVILLVFFFFFFLYICSICMYVYISIHYFYVNCEFYAVYIVLALYFIAADFGIQNIAIKFFFYYFFSHYINKLIHSFIFVLSSIFLWLPLFNLFSFFLSSKTVPFLCTSG